MLKQRKLLAVIVLLAVFTFAAIGIFATDSGRKCRTWFAGKPWIRNGERIEYYPDGKIRLKQTRRNGKSDGPFTMWYPNGNKLTEVSFSNGERAGKCEAWHKNGARSYTGQFTEGKYEGKWSFFDTNGNQVAEVSCKNGIFWEGTDARYLDDTLLITTYREGKIVSSEKRRD